MYNSKILIAVILLLLISCNSKNGKPIPKNEFTGIDRTIKLLNENKEIEILFYGQSIIGGMGSDIFIDSLKKFYPKSKIKFKHKPIGGFTLPKLLKTSNHDLFHENPDLIIFHAYEGIDDGSYDTLIKNIRNKMTSEILLLDHHLVWNKSKETLKKINESHDFYSNEIKKIADKYNCGFLSIRSYWKEYLEKNKIEANELIGNTIDSDVHPNKKGNELLRSILLSHFRNSTYQETQKDNLRSIVNLFSFEREQDYYFSGKLIVVETERKFNKNSKLKILIDNKSPSTYKDNFYITRPSSGLNSWMPAILKVSFGDILPRDEEWQLKIIEINRKDKSFKFQLYGNKTGFDGEGNSKSDFVSNSKRIKIQKDDLYIFPIEKISKTLTPENFQVNFQVKSIVSDTITLERRKSKYTIYRGFDEKKHKLHLKIVGGNPKLERLIIHKPPF